MATPDNNFLNHTPGRTDIERGWVLGVRAGDERAFERIFYAYNRQLYQFALSLLGSPDEAEDVVQGVFVAIWEHQASWAVHGNLQVYLFTAVRNRAFERLRRVRTRDRLQGEAFALKSRFLSQVDPCPMPGSNSRSSRPLSKPPWRRCRRVCARHFS